MTRSFNRPPLLFSISTLLLMLLMACAMTTENGKANREEAPSETAKLESLKSIGPELNTAEDSLILDLLIGYQALWMNAGNPDSAGSQSLHRAQHASKQLEYMLRYGGVVNQGREGRVVTLPDGTRLTLQEAVAQMSRALLHPGKGDDWKPATNRALEIQKHKEDLSALVEDAHWVLALSAALESSLPDEVKNGLRHLHESYARGDSHEIIVQQVNTLLPEVKSDSLRRELKKLANRSWDRDKRMGGTSATPNPVVPAGTQIQAPPSPTPSPTLLPTLTPPSSQGSQATAVVEKPDSAADIASFPSLKETEVRVDSLASAGQYLEALQVLETIEEQADTKWIAAHRQSLGNHYCEDRRNAAATAFISARKATQDSVRVLYLQQSLSALDSCLFQFPDAPVAAKVRRNRALVEKELSR